MSSTSPSTPETLTQSPTFTGRSISRITPATKFCTICCRPKPMPTERALAIRAIWAKPRPVTASAQTRATATPT